MAAPPGAGFTGTVFRQSSPRHATIDKHTLAASSRAGGRFNGANEFGAIYVSLDPETPVRELYRQCVRSGVRLADLLPRTLFAAEARLHRVLDLTDRDVLAAWSLDAGALSGDDWHPCQEVARQARRSGYEAIRFPSATGEGVNLAVFLDRLLPGSLLRVLEEKPLTVPVRYT